MFLVQLVLHNHLPWSGFFDNMFRCDVFVFYDDVQFDKHGWHNLNCVKSPVGPASLTVPVRHKGLGKPRILDVEIDRQAWVPKHIGTLRQFYVKAPFLNRYLPELEELLQRWWERIVDLDIGLVALICSWLGLKRQIERSSQMSIHGKRSYRLLNICLHFGAIHYFTGNAAKSYLHGGLFASRGVEVQWQNYQHPVYFHHYREFVPYLSIIDLLLNCGEQSATILVGGERMDEA